MWAAAISHASRHSIQPIITANRSRLGPKFLLIHLNCEEICWVTMWMASSFTMFPLRTGFKSFHRTDLAWNTMPFPGIKSSTRHSARKQPQCELTMLSLSYSVITKMFLAWTVPLESCNGRVKISRSKPAAVKPEHYGSLLPEVRDVRLVTSHFLLTALWPFIRHSLPLALKGSYDIDCGVCYPHWHR